MDLLLVLVHFADRADAHPSGFSVRGGQMSPEEAFVGPRFVLLCEAEPLQSQSVGCGDALGCITLRSVHLEMALLSSVTFFPGYVTEFSWCGVAKLVLVTRVTVLWKTML